LDLADGRAHDILCFFFFLRENEQRACSCAEFFYI
jgi:hypothetical protein